MTYSLLITPAQLDALRTSGQTPSVVFDCSFDLTDTAAGLRQYESGHVERARYLHLDTHLSAQAGESALNGGRHPLPEPDAFAKTMAAFGVTPQTQVVVYDRQGVNFCGRAWWMLREMLGHQAVAVLDGGWQAWVAAGLPVASGADAPLDPPTGTPTLIFEQNRLNVGEFRRFLAIDSVANAMKDKTPIIDARPGPRFRGEVEPLDPIAGHVPGALNRPFADNQAISADGISRFKSPEQLRAEFTALLGTNPKPPIHHCGSGVSAVPNLIAMELAGFGRQSLYPGGWSEWSRTSGMAVARGSSAP